MASGSLSGRPAVALVASILTLTLACVGAPVSGQAGAAVPAAPGEIDWSSDLDALVRELEARHPGLQDRVSRSGLDSLAEETRSRLRTADDASAAIALERLVARIGDPHTTIRLDPERLGFLRYPARFAYYDDGLRVLAASRDDRPLLGARVVAMGGLPVDAVLERLRTLQGADNDEFWKSWVGGYVLPDILHAVGVAADRYRIEIETVGLDGERQSHELVARPWDERIDLTSGRELLRGRPPLHMSNERSSYWTRYIGGRRTLYLQFNRLEENPRMGSDEFIRRVLALLEDEPVAAVVVDLRHNGGGDSRLMAPLLEGLGAWRQQPEKRLYGIIGPGTFSSAVQNTLQLRRMGAVLVGQPTGGRPDHFGEVEAFKLPSSGLQVTCSTRFFRWAEAGDPPSVRPDIEVPRTFDDIRTGRDPAPEVILDGRPPPPPETP